jgi:hypothetical protein
MQTAAVEKRQPFFCIRAEKRRMPDFFEKTLAMRQSLWYYNRAVSVLL